MRRAAPDGSEHSACSLPRALVRTSVDVPVGLPGGEREMARAFTFSSLVDQGEHLALGLGSYLRPLTGTPVVRVHSECLTGDVFRSRRCDCGSQLEESMAAVASTGGYLLYLRQEGRGIGLYAKLDAYGLQDQGLDTFEANMALGYDEDPRDYRVAAQMLIALGVNRVDLLTGNPRKASELASWGIGISGVFPTRRHETSENTHYLAAKMSRGHRFHPQAPVSPVDQHLYS